MKPDVLASSSSDILEALPVPLKDKIEASNVLKTENYSDVAIDLEIADILNY